MLLWHLLDCLDKDCYIDGEGSSCQVPDALWAFKAAHASLRHGLILVAFSHMTGLAKSGYSMMQQMHDIPTCSFRVPLHNQM